MANTTASIVANYGDGTKTLTAFHSKGRPLPMIEAFCAAVVIPQGVATGQFTKQGAALTASGASEEDAAATPQAFNALTTATLTPASYVAAVSPTTEAINRANNDIVDLVKLHEDEVVYPHRRIVAYDASIGIVKVRFGGLSNRVGTSGADFAPTTLINAYLQLCTQLNQDVDAVAWLTLKQWTEMMNYSLTTAASAWGGPAVNPLFLDLLKANDAPVHGYKTSWGPIHIFVDPDPSGHGVDGSGNDISAMFVPWLGGLNRVPLPAEVGRRYSSITRAMPGGLPIAPAFGIGYREEPAAAPRRLSIPAGMGATIITDAGIPIEVLPRIYAGQNLAQIDAWSMVTTVEINDDSGVGLRSVTA